MAVTYFYLSLVIGLTISLLIEETFGISAGGMIVPAYLSMISDDPGQIMLIFSVSFLVYFIINYILPHFIILFGKRKFVATLIVGVIIKLIFELMFPILPFQVVEFRGIGIITPALIANTYAKQGIRYTIPSVLIATYLTFLLVNVFIFVL